MVRRLLAIESSCDETGLALFEFNSDRITLLDSVLASQIDVHRDYGGVVPEIASREHLRTLPMLYSQLVGDKGIDYVAVTEGPGLKGCLLMGMGFGKALASSRGIPYLGINHIEGHVWSAALSHSLPNQPFLALIVSGGHTELIHVSALGDYSVIARTSDDAAGEAFDKSGNLLGLPYPSGAGVAKLADSVTASRFKLPRVMRESEGFSFSGLKTAIALLVKKNSSELTTNSELKSEIAFAVQQSIVDAIVFKVREAINRSPVEHLVLGGGVAANSALRRALQDLPVTVLAPQVEYCTDNAAMIGYVACKRALRGEVSQLSSEPRPGWPLEELR